MPLTSSITKNGRPVSVAPASSTLAMFGWSMSARAWRSASKRAMTCLGVHAQLDDLERHAAADRLLLFGHIDDAAAAFADLLQQFVAADSVARLSLYHPVSRRVEVAKGGWWNASKLLLAQTPGLTDLLPSGRQGIVLPVRHRATGCGKRDSECSPARFYAPCQYWSKTINALGEPCQAPFWNQGTISLVEGGRLMV